jgi:sec-independent protein translocase protein TatB
MDLGFSGEMILIALLGLILFGPRKLPEIARTLGRFMTDLKRVSTRFQEQLNREVGNLELVDPTKSLLTSLADDLRALNSVKEPAKAISALTEPTQPGGASLIDNVNRIKDLLAKNEADAEAVGAERPPQPAEPAAPEISAEDWRHEPEPQPSQRLQ